MRKKRIAHAAGAITMACVLFFSSFNVSAASSAGILKKGMSGSEVKQLQSDLKTLGYFNANTTGYFGSITYSSVMKLQREYGYTQDGIVGRNTQALIDRLLGSGNSSSESASVLSVSSSSSRSVLKEGMRGDDVKALQNDLKALGYFSATPTGYYGDITVTSVKNLQRDYGYSADGIVGSNTSSLIAKLKENPSSLEKVNISSRGNAQRTSYKAPWYSEASRIFSRGTTATVYDIDTGLSFKVKRTYGTNHADCETLTAEDTKIMKKIYGGSWSWTRRAIIVDVDGTKLAASMAGMPHAGVESAPANKTVSSRSGGYGKGTNLDAVKGNNMSGVFDIHFYQSKTHGTQRVDEKHQAAVKKAAEWAEKNLG